MSAEPLVLEAARLALSLINRLQLKGDGRRSNPARVLAFHFLRHELQLTYAQTRLLIGGNTKTIYENARRGDDLYAINGPYRRAYDKVRENLPKLMALETAGAA